MEDGAVVVPLALLEGRHLLALIEEFRLIIESADDDDRDLTRRLVPDAYPDDSEASAEFGALTRGDLFDRRLSDGAAVRQDLVGSGFDDENSDEDPLGPRELAIPVERLDAWMRTLTAMRLMMASRLGIGQQDAHDPEDPRFGVYDWLGYRLDGLIQLADEIDEEA